MFRKRKIRKHNSSFAQASEKLRLKARKSMTIQFSSCESYWKLQAPFKKQYLLFTKVSPTSTDRFPTNFRGAETPRV